MAKGAGKKGGAGKAASKTSGGKRVAVEALRHEKARRRNIPTAETQAFMAEEEAKPTPKLYPRNPDLDPQLVWRGKDEQDSGPLVVPTVPVYIQEKIKPSAIVHDLLRVQREKIEPQLDMYADFNGIAEEDKLDFYQHDQNWSNRMILGDALLVMNSLAEKEGLKGQVQMIYIDPPYGIKFASNWQPSTKSKTVGDGVSDVSREPEVIKAFRDAWAEGIHSYLSYLRDRLVVARDLLNESGSIFVQIGEENAHLVRSLLDEVFGRQNAVVTIVVKKKGSQRSTLIDPVNDYILWYSKTPREEGRVKFRPLYEARELDADTLDEFSMVELPNGDEVDIRDVRAPTGGDVDYRLRPQQLFRDHQGARLFRANPLTSGGERVNQSLPFDFQGRTFSPGVGNCWKHTARSDGGGLCGMARLAASARIIAGAGQLRFRSYFDDFPYKQLSNWWDGLGGASKPIYVVQTNEEIVKRCLLMTTDPGDLALDPTCGSGTTAYVAEQWGRRWITIDTSRVALALARTRLMAARFPFYLLKDSPEGAQREAEVAGRPPHEGPFGGDLRHGFVYREAPHITSGVIANDAEIDVIHVNWQPRLDAAREEINKLLKKSWQEWEVPRRAEEGWSAAARAAHAAFWQARRERQAEIDASIARNAETEFLYDRPYEKKNTVRVTGPFTVESLSPHRVLPPDEEDEALLAALDAQDHAQGREPPARRAKALRPKSEASLEEGSDAFVQAVLENLKKAGVQNTRKGERLEFSDVKPYAGGRYIHAEGRYREGEKDKRAAIVIGPEYGTVGKELILAAGREAVESPVAFELLVVCGFAFDPHVAEGEGRLGRLRVIRARMNQDLHMADRLKATGAGNLFVAFGEPDIRLEKTGDGNWMVEIKGVDIFDPTTGEVRASAKPEEDIACWFLDTDYDESSFFVRHAYFLGGRDPYEKLKRALKAEIDEGAWATLYGTESRPFPPPKSGRIAVKVINHYGDEVMKVFEVPKGK
jgi:adenine-specific DNA-methyltransferase